jgi:uncharacterized protein YidB (DUF937 family)
MKKVLALLLGSIALGSISQTLSPIVVSSAGGYSTGTTVNLSWTLGELATETLINGTLILTQGFQQPVEGVTISINLDLLVFLEGPYSGLEMGTSLNTEGVIPLSQPYNTAPWNYSGTESVISVPNVNVTDWVLVELRDAANAASATPATQIARQAAFLLKDGSVVGTDGSSILNFNNLYNQQLFVIVWHRNHLGIMTANGVTESGGIYSYDFSTSSVQVHGGAAGYKNISGGVWGMVAGDATHDGLINLSDKIQWTTFAGKRGYLDTDFNLNIQVNNPDKNNYWLPNQTLSCQVPQ